MDTIQFGHKYIFGSETEPLMPIKFEVFHAPEFKIEITCFTVKQYKKYEKFQTISKLDGNNYTTVAQEQKLKMPKPRIVTLKEGDQIKEVLS